MRTVSRLAAALAALLLLAPPVPAQQAGGTRKLGMHNAPQLPYDLSGPDTRVTRKGEVRGDGEPFASVAEIMADVEQAAPRTVPQDYAPRPAIWKIGDADTIIYLFGTIHVLPPGFRWRSATLDRIVAQSRTLLLESTEDDPDADSLMLGAPTEGAEALPPLIERVSPERRELLMAFQRSLPGEAVSLMDGMPTWVAALAVTYMREAGAGETLAPGADDWLEAHFRSAGKRIEAIEDSSKVVASVNAIPEAEQRAMLEAALVAPAETLEELHAPTHAWARGEVGPDSPLLVDFARDGSTPLQGPLIDRRNAAWADSLVRRLRTPGVTLFAAGAGHFVGKDSVLELLEKRGVRVVRVE